MRDPGEALVDMLLREMVGGDLPPKLTAGIQAKLARRRRRVWYLRIGAAAAAVLMVTAGLFVSLTSGPGPDKRTAQHINPSRNSVIMASKEPVTVALGEYCYIEAAPESVIRITGEDQKEQVFLEKGEVACEIEPGQGTFAVETAVGTVAVKGTKFSVRLLDDEIIPGQDVPVRRMFVQVNEGAVEVSGNWGIDLVRAGERITVPKRTAPKMSEAREPAIAGPELKPGKAVEKPKFEKKLPAPVREKPVLKPAQKTVKPGKKAGEAVREQKQEKRQDQVKAMDQKKQAVKEAKQIQKGKKKSGMDISARIKGFASKNRKSMSDSKQRMLMLLRLKNGKGPEFSESEYMVRQYAEEKGISAEQARRELISLIEKFKTSDNKPDSIPGPQGPGTGLKSPGTGPKGPGKGPGGGPGGGRGPGRRR